MRTAYKVLAYLVAAEVAVQAMVMVWFISGLGKWVEGRRPMSRRGVVPKSPATCENSQPASLAHSSSWRCAIARNRHVSRAVALSAAAALAVSLSACSSTAQASKTGTFYGSELALGNGKVKTYVVAAMPATRPSSDSLSTPHRSTVCPNRRMTPKLGRHCQASRCTSRMRPNVWR